MRAAAGSSEGRREPLRGVRRVIAEHMARAHREVPAVTWVEECDFSGLDLKQLVPITGRLEGRDIGSVITDVNAILTAEHFPVGYTYAIGGIYESQQESFRSLLYLEQRKHAGRTQIKSFTGPAAIEQYLEAEHKGRLIQSLQDEMLDASRDLRFEEAARLRDEISELKRELREVV